jgi:sugar phosphate isomerase/epimerase
MTLRFGYGTNGFANHRLDDALALIADLGYVGVALTLDHHHLDPFEPDLFRRTRALANRLSSLGLAVVVETGARYLLDPWRKHSPTLLDEDPLPRLEFLRLAVRVGADLGAEAVSFWAGVRPSTLDPVHAWRRLVRGCGEVLSAAAAAEVMLGFEPEPGMLVQTIDGWERLRADLGAPVHFGLTLDIGHCKCLEPQPVADCVRRVAGLVVNVQIDDMRRGVHDFPSVLRALDEAGYGGLVAVELPRHSHAAPTIARESLAFLRTAEQIATLPVARSELASPAASANATLPVARSELASPAASANATLPVARSELASPAASARLVRPGLVEEMR